MICQDRWEQTKNGEEAVYLLYVWEREMFVGSVAVQRTDRLLAGRLARESSNSWMMEEKKGGEEHWKIEPRQCRLVPEKKEEEEEGGGAEKAANSCIDVCLNVVLQS